MWGKESLGVWDGHAHTAVFKMNNQQRLTVEHRELCSILSGSLDGRGVWGERVHVHTYMAESLCCAPEIITALLSSYTPI